MHQPVLFVEQETSPTAAVAAYACSVHLDFSIIKQVRLFAVDALKDHFLLPGVAHHVHCVNQETSLPLLPTELDALCVTVEAFPTEVEAQFARYVCLASSTMQLDRLFANPVLQVLFPTLWEILPVAYARQDHILEIDSPPPAQLAQLASSPTLPVPLLVTFVRRDLSQLQLPQRAQSAPLGHTQPMMVLPIVHPVALECTP